MLLAPMAEVQIQAAGNHHHSIAPALVPGDPFHGLGAQRGGKDVPCESLAARLQLLRRDAPEAEAANQLPDQRAGDDPRLVAKDERQEEDATEPQAMRSNRCAHESRHGLAIRDRPVKIEQCKIHLPRVPVVTHKMCDSSQVARNGHPAQICAVIILPGVRSYWIGGSLGSGSISAKLGALPER